MSRTSRTLFVSILFLTIIAAVCAQKKELTIIAGDSFIPYSFYNDEGAATGIDIEYLNKIAEKLSIKVNFILTPWETAFDKLLSGEGDVVLSVTPSMERSAYLDFSKSYTSLEMYVFFNKNNQNIFKRSDLDNIPVGMPEGTPYKPFFKDIAVNPVFYDGYQNVYKAVANNEIPTALSPDITGSYFLAKLGVSNMFKRMNDPILSEKLTMTVRKGDSETLDLINKGIALINEKEYEDIINSFIGVEVRLLELINFKLLIIIVLCIILIISVVMVWNILLRKSVSVITRELRVEKENLHVTIDSIQDAVISTDISCKIIMMNPSAEKLTGFNIQQSLGNDIDTIFKIYDSKTKNYLLIQLYMLLRVKIRSI
jgi:ABC-type amino acid transport substrate-binding protein